MKLEIYIYHSSATYLNTYILREGWFRTNIASALIFFSCGIQLHLLGNNIKDFVSQHLLVFLKCLILFFFFFLLYCNPFEYYVN